VIDAVSDWILEPNKRHVEPAEVYNDRENRQAGREAREREDRGGGGGGRNGRDGGGNKEETRGLASYLFSTAYRAGASLFTGDFSALSLGSDAEDEMKVWYSRSHAYIHVYVYAYIHACVRTHMQHTVRCD
jgi:hypothetical protein